MLSALTCLRQCLSPSCRSAQINRLTRVSEPLWYGPCHKHASFTILRYSSSSTGHGNHGSKRNVSNVSPEKRQHDLYSTGFHYYPRAPSREPMSISAFYERSRISLGEHGLHTNQTSAGVEPNRDRTVASVQHSFTPEGSVDTSSKDHIASNTEQSSSRSFEKSSRLTDAQTKHITDHGWAGEPNVVTVSGRIQAIRAAGTKLLFIDIVDQPSAKLQVVVDANKLYVDNASGASNSVKAFRRSIQRGDTIHVTGSPYTTTAGELSLRAVELPRLTSPCLHQIPETSFGVDSDFAHDRHVQMLTEPSMVEGLIARARTIEAMSDFLRGLQFVNVQTPILAASAGGANARSFETSATEFPDRKLALRIAPELWLKRLIVGGMRKVFEIGPSFRNEGLDKTHNPEFTTCEFYAVNWSLETLQRETTKMIRSIVRSLGDSTSPSFVNSIGDAHTIDEPSPWPSIDFIPALKNVLELDLPDLSDSSAREQIVEIFKTKGLTLPTTPTLPRLLDKLSSIYLEPQCRTATWIINMPECMSPLAKSFGHPQLPHQQVSARAELFIDHKEVVNCYEEENSPIEQRRKFIDQQRYARLGQEVDEEAMKIDEDYIRALEWGLPPTGGWGCGVDRLCMLMLGKDNISDVLSFGNLRSVTRGAEKWKSQGQ